MSVEQPISLEYMPSYAEQLSAKLRIGPIIDDLYLLYGSWKESLKSESEFDSDEGSLRRIRRFLKEDKVRVGKITRGTIVENRDCITKCVLGSCLADREGHEACIVRPKLLRKHFHTLLMLPGGKKFEMAGKDYSYPVIPMTPQEVALRLRLVRPLVSGVNRFRRRL